MTIKRSQRSQIGQKTREFALIAIFGILTVISFQGSLLEIFEQDLANHMVLEHTLFFVIGALSVIIAEIVLRFIISYEKASRHRHPDHLKNNYYIQHEPKYCEVASNSRLIIVISNWTKILRKIFGINNHGLVWVIIAVDLMIFWHIPSVFDFASLYESFHILQHVSFIAVGAAGFLAIRSLGESFSIFLLFTIAGMMGFAGLVFAILENPIYSVYSVNSHHDAGTYMLVSCMLIILIALPVYLIEKALFHVKIKAGKNTNDHRS
jgi:glycosyltransferase involved in cell wall biosynthesis